MRLTNFIVAVVASSFALSCSSKDKMTFTETQGSDFKTGQVWSYKARADEGDSTLTVCKVETAGKLGTVVHISVKGVKLKNPTSKDGVANNIAHLPFSETALKQSVSKLIQEGAVLPDYVEGYSTWRKAVEGGKGGVWTTTVAETIASMESVLNK
jgi:hypothetical protein